MNEPRARRLARAVGGDAWNSGGGIWLAVVPKADGKVVALSDEVVCEYASEEELLAGEAEASILLVAAP